MTPSTGSTNNTEKETGNMSKSTEVPVSSDSAPSHYKDWPNTFAFDTDYVQNEPIELKVTGEIPAYAAGTLYRTGPGVNKVECNNGKQFEAIHWFDGFTVVHRFHIKVEEPGGPVRVIYNSKCTADKLIEHIRKTGQFKDFGFAQKRDPCQSFFKKLMSYFLPTAGIDKKAVNIGVALTPNMPGINPAKGYSSSRIQSITARTDAAKYQTLDPETLEPVGVCDQTTLNPALKGAISGTHAKTCPLTGDVFNYNLDVGRKSFYRVFQACASTGQTHILAEIEAPPAYLHSIFLTENTVVLCIWNSHFAYNGLAILYHRNVLDAIAPLNPDEPARWYVVDRTPARRGLLATFHTPAFFCFHTINAYEEPSPTSPGQTDIIADLITYTDLSVLHRFYYTNLLSTSSTAADYLARQDTHRGNFTRYRLPDIPISSSSSSSPFSLPTSPRKATPIFQGPKSHTLELPTLSPLHQSRKYRYHYGTSDSGLSTFFDGIGKYDAVTGEAIFWREKGQTPGEPIFVPSPRARERGGRFLGGGGEKGNGKGKGMEGEGDGVKEHDGKEGKGDQGDDEYEDDGVLLSVVVDGVKEESYLLVLDARDLREVGRAEMRDFTGASPAEGAGEAEAEVEEVGKGTEKREREEDEEGKGGREGGEERKKKRMVVGIGFHGVHVPEAREGVVGGGE
ncbi:hypothetical protein MMC10_003210 [Thelotrema lepadinum]|nr:hypothetical protein [Thelotrema lepadinum]